MTTPKQLPQEALKPCPFCGHVGLHFSDGSTFRWLDYSCAGCGIGSEVRMQTLGDGTKEQWRAQAEQDAIKEWNTRSAPPASQELPPLPPGVGRCPTPEACSRSCCHGACLPEGCDL